MAHKKNSKDSKIKTLRRMATGKSEPAKSPRKKTTKPNSEKSKNTAKKLTTKNAAAPKQKIPGFEEKIECVKKLIEESKSFSAQETKSVINLESDSKSIAKRVSALEAQAKEHSKKIAELLDVIEMLSKQKI